MITKREMRIGLLTTAALGMVVIADPAMATDQDQQPETKTAAPAPQTDTAIANAAPTGTDATNPTTDGGLGEIVVSAQKRNENLQKVPISVTALDADFLAKRNIVDAAQLNGLVPGVSIQPSFILLTYIRGLGNYSSQPGVDQSVAYNVDDIYISKPYGMPTVLFDLDRVEMLRGPQGTLQGRNAVAGAINFVTAKPKEEFEASASASYGNYDATVLEGMVNVPIADGYALRIAAKTAQHDGYFDNGYGDQNVTGIRASLLARPTPELDAVIVGEYTKRNELGSTYSPCPPGSTAAQGCAGVKWDPWAGTPGQGTSETLNMAEPNMLWSENRAVYAHVNYDLGFATLTWVPNYRTWKYRNHQSLSHFFGYAPAVHDDMHSEELRLASNRGSPVQWVVGAYYGRESAEEENYFTSASETQPFVTIDRPGFWPIGHVYFKNDIYNLTYRSQSLFAQVTVPVTDTIRITGGLRYTDDLKKQSGNTGIVLSDPITGAPYINSVDVTGKFSSQKLNYRAGVEFDAARDVMLYANISTAYKAGGVNGVPPGSDFPPTFGPEDMTAYQAGIKSRFLDDHIQVNAEGFYYDYRGYQTSGFDVTDEGVLIGGTFNSQKARLYGGEIESAFVISPNDRLGVNLTFLSAKYVKFDVPATGAHFSGTKLQNAPAFTFTVDYSHTFDLDNGGTIVAHAQTHHESEQWVDYRHSAGSLSGPLWRSLADITYNSPDSKWSVTAFIDNITNDDALLVANAGLGPYMLATPYPPRTFGVRVSAHY